jgi:peptidoglycan biosynthesis protein MviN/MurJ (putative lipid II flippase)
LALSLSAILEFSLLFRVLRRRLGGLDEEKLVGSVAKAGAATVVMAEVVGLLALLLHASGHFDTGTFGDAFLALFCGSVIGAGVFFAVSSFLAHEEMELLERRLPILRSINLFARLSGSPSSAHTPF